MITAREYARSCIRSQKYTCVSPPALQPPRSPGPSFQTSLCQLDRRAPIRGRAYSRPLHIPDNSNTSGWRYALCIMSLLFFQARASFLLSIHFLLSAVCYCREEKTAAFAAQAISISYLFLTCSLFSTKLLSHLLCVFTSTSLLFIAISRLLASCTAPNTTTRRTHVCTPLPNREVSILNIPQHTAAD
jgi:hypothetical protein